MTRTPSRVCVSAHIIAGLALMLVAGCGDDELGHASTTSTTRSSFGTSVNALTGPTCSPTGAHAKHAPFGCSTCHLCGGVVQFDPSGPAAANGATPSFDPASQTCSSVACHAVAAGTFTYTFWDWGCPTDPDGCLGTKSVSYGGATSTTPSWFSTGLGCGACHGNPPPAYSQWHGNHANNGPGKNDCQLCHPDAVGTNGVGTGFSTATNCGPNGTFGSCAALHANGTLNVQPRWDSSCMGCH
jgi:hypothetical protein